jgi:hypothetical protein
MSGSPGPAGIPAAKRTAAGRTAGAGTPAPAADGPPAVPPGAPGWQARLAEPGLRVGGTVIGVLAGMITAVYEGFLSPLRWGGVHAPVAPVLALIVNPLLVWFTHRVTGSRTLALLPGLAWCLVLVVAALGTDEGDIMLAGNNWMAVLLMAAGAISWATAAALMVMPPRPSSPVPGPPAAGPRSARRPG